MENIEEAVRETRELLAKYTELTSKIGKGTPEEEEKLANEVERVQNAIDAANGWELERTLERAMDALRCPDGDAKVNPRSEQTLPFRQIVPFLFRDGERPRSTPLSGSF